MTSSEIRSELAAMWSALDDEVGHAAPALRLTLACLAFSQRPL